MKNSYYITDRIEGVPPHEIIRCVRQLMPLRALQDHEARGVAERQALRLLTLLDQSSPAVDVELLSELPRVEVRLAPNLPMSGASSWESSRWRIVLSADDHPVRQRFTLAHEFKHVLDHPFIRCLYPGPDGQPSAQRAESICDWFAGCLLMPRPWVKRAWVAGVQDVGALAKHFGVSRPAMSVRLQQLGLTLPRPRCTWARSAKTTFLGRARPGRTSIYQRALPTPTLMAVGL